MIVALTLALLAPASAGPGSNSPPAARAADPNIQVWLNSDHNFVRGDRARVHIRAAQDGYVIVLRADGDGRVRVLFPLDPSADDFVRGGRKIEVRGRGDREAFTVDERTGAGVVLAAWSARPFSFDKFVRGDHWDYRVLDTLQSGDDPEAALLDIVQGMADDNHFDYDAITYTVTSVSAYYRRPYVGPYVGPYFGPCFGCGRRHHFRVGVSIGVGYPYYYGGFGYGAFYDPFYYSDFYYRYSDFHYRPFVYRPFVFGGGRFGGYHPYRSAFIARGQSPFVFNDRERVTPVQVRARQSWGSERPARIASRAPVARAAPRDRAGRGSYAPAPRSSGSGFSRAQPSSRGSAGSPRASQPSGRGGRGGEGRSGVGERRR